MALHRRRLAQRLGDEHLFVHREHVASEDDGGRGRDRRLRVVEQVGAGTHVVHERRGDERGVLQQRGRCVGHDVGSGGARFGRCGQPGEPVEVEPPLGEQVAGDLRIGEDRAGRLAVARQRLHQHVQRVAATLHRRAAGLVHVVAERRREPARPNHRRPGQVLGTCSFGRGRALVLDDRLRGRDEEVTVVVDVVEQEGEGLRGVHAPVVVAGDDPVDQRHGEPGRHARAVRRPPQLVPDDRGQSAGGVRVTVRVGHAQLQQQLGAARAAELGEERAHGDAVVGIADERPRERRHVVGLPSRRSPEPHRPAPRRGPRPATSPSPRCR